MNYSVMDLSPLSVLKENSNLKISGNPGELTKGISFNGRDTGIWLYDISFREVSSFVVDVRFEPFGNSPEEQRFFHIQDPSSENRFLLETRVTSDGHWFADTYFEVGDKSILLQDSRLMHPCDEQHRYTAAYDGATLSQYINGELELKDTVPGLKLPDSATVSIGIRGSNEYPYKGIINSIFFYPNISDLPFSE